MTEMLSMWDTTAAEVSTQRTRKALALAEAAVEPLWPFLAEAKTMPEFEHRLALSEESLIRSVASVATDESMPVDQMRLVATQRLTERFAAAHRARSEEMALEAALRAAVAAGDSGQCQQVNDDGVQCTLPAGHSAEEHDFPDLKGEGEIRAAAGRRTAAGRPLFLALDSMAAMGTRPKTEPEGATYSGAFLTAFYKAAFSMDFPNSYDKSSPHYKAGLKDGKAAGEAYFATGEVNGVVITGSRRTASWVEQARTVVSEHQHATVDGVLLDATSANMLLTVHDALSPDKAAQFAAMPLAKAVEIGWKLVNKTSAKSAGAGLVCTCGHVDDAHSGKWCQHCADTMSTADPKHSFEPVAGKTSARKTAGDEYRESYAEGYDDFMAGRPKDDTYWITEAYEIGWSDAEQGLPRDRQRGYGRHLSSKTAGREIVSDSGGRRYVKERKGSLEYRYYEDGSVTILNTSKPFGTNRTVGHTGPNPDRIPEEFRKSASLRGPAVTALLAEASDETPVERAGVGAKPQFEVVVGDEVVGQYASRDDAEDKVRLLEEDEGITNAEIKEISKAARRRRVAWHQPTYDYAYGIGRADADRPYDDSQWATEDGHTGYRDGYNDGGYHEASRRTATEEKTCPACEGGGVFADMLCQTCGGYGKVSSRKSAVADLLAAESAFFRSPQAPNRPSLPAETPSRAGEREREIAHQERVRREEQQRVIEQAERNRAANSGTTGSRVAFNPKMGDPDYEAGYLAGSSDAGSGIRFNPPESSSALFAEGYSEGYDGWNSPTHLSSIRRHAEDIATRLDGLVENTDTGGPVQTQPLTTRPRVVPSDHQRNDPGQQDDFADNPDFAPTDPMRPTVGQKVQARVARLTARIKADNPTMSDRQARALAARTVQAFPEMVSTTQGA